MFVRVITTLLQLIFKFYSWYLLLEEFKLFPFCAFISCVCVCYWVLRKNHTVLDRYMVISTAKTIKLIKRMHPFRSSHPGMFLVKSRSENMHQIYRRTSMPKCDFNKITKQLYWNHTSAWALFCRFAAYFQNTFY